MKIELRRRDSSGFWVIAVALVCAVVVIVGIGGCVAGKVIENASKYKARRDRQLTNEVDQIAGQMLQDYVARTGDTNARMSVTLSTMVAGMNGSTAGVVLQCSTNLVDWSDVDGPLELTQDLIGSAARSMGAPPMMFFRLNSVP